MFLQQRLITLWLPLTKVVTVVVVVTIFLFVYVWPVVVCHSCCICVYFARSGHNTTFGMVSIDIFFGCNIDEEDSLIFPTDIGSISICLWTRDNIDRHSETNHHPNQGNAEDPNSIYILMFIFKLVNIKCFSTHTPYWDLNYPTQYTYLCSFQTCED